MYRELRRLAHHYLRNEREGHTLQSTALVHEAYLRLVKQDAPHFENRAHFMAISAQLMRQVLVEYARRRGAAKRDGGRRVTIEDSIELGQGKEMDLLALEDALVALARLDARQCRIVELRFFAGLTVEQTADAMGISAPTVKREWSSARAWLHREIRKAGPA